jgi:hypothetical protein
LPSSKSGSAMAGEGRSSSKGKGSGRGWSCLPGSELAIDSTWCYCFGDSRNIATFVTTL